MTFHEIAISAKEYKDIIGIGIAIGTAFVFYKKYIHRKVLYSIRNIINLWTTPKVMRKEIMELSDIIRASSYAQSEFTYKTLHRLDEIEKLVNETRAMVYPNGGTSLSDQISILSGHIRSLDNDEMIIHTDAIGNCQFASVRLLEFTGKQLSWMLNMGYFNIISQQEREKIKSSLIGSMNESTEYSGEFFIADKSKALYQCYCTTMRLHGATGKIIGYRIKINLI